MSLAENILGIEGGGTKTTWALFTPEGKLVKRGQAGPGNTMLLGDTALEKLFGAIRREAGKEITAIGAACAGCLERAEQARVEKILRRVWPRATAVRAMEDTRSVLAAAFGAEPGLVVIAGTGSNVAGQKSARAPIEKAGGWGHLFADRGSAYDLARRGLETAFQRYDENRKISVLAREYLAAAGVETMEALVAAALRDTNKTVVAQGARSVFAAAKKGDRDARRLLDEATLALAEKVALIARRLRLTAPRVALVGGLFENRPEYRARFQRALRRTFPRARAFLLTVPGTVGAARLAGLKAADVALPTETKKRSGDRSGPSRRLRPGGHGAAQPPLARARPPFRPAAGRSFHPRGAPRRERPARAAEAERPGREPGGEKAQGRRTAFYVGAGTSGRLGVVDASEMPPTFNAPPEQIQALIAGGPAAVFRSQEGAEDSREAGAAELRARG